MTIAAGTRLGAYEITSAIGAGGMGEVYRARDTRLGRDVAIKVLPEAFARNAERMARFEREAKVLASLDHPHIASIYGLEDSGGIRALVMQFAEGPTLADRISAGPIPVDEAVRIARQIADALEYAHEHGIVHRDLKPANIKISRDDSVKILDFGLAKAIQGEASETDVADSPTISRMATRAGVLLGTAAYMSPEQAKGKPVDRRADIWAFGCVLYEMLTGRQAFGGETTTDVLAAVVTKDPVWNALPAATPTHVRVLLQRCLQKDPKQRLRDIGDARISLDEVVSGAAKEIQGLSRAAVPIWRRLAVGAGALVLAAGIGGAAVWFARPAPAPKPLTRLNVDLGPEAMTGPDITVAISPDGRRLVFPARGPDGRQELATQLLDQSGPTLLPGTEGGSDPFFSPDGQWIGFFAGSQLKKIQVQGGSPVTLCNLVVGSLGDGGSWGKDGNIVFGSGVAAPLYQVPAIGGTPKPFTKLGPDVTKQVWPQFLPGGNAVLFTASISPVSFDNANIEAESLTTGRVKIVQRGGYYGRYLPNGYLVFVHDGTLFGEKFDLQRLEVSGSPVPILEGLAANAATGGGQFDFSSTGTLVYEAGKTTAQGWQIAWLDSSGKIQPLLATPGDYEDPRLSPDGRELAFGQGGDIYVDDLQRNTTTRLTFTDHAYSPVWVPDGKHLVFVSVSNGFSVYWIRSDGSGSPQLLLHSPTRLIPWSASPDGRYLAYFLSRPNSDIGTLPLDLADSDHPKPGKPQQFLRTSAREAVPRFSPDGRWIAYRKEESGSNEIYVRPFPATSGGQWQISSGGGLYAFWSKDGHELFYETNDNRIMVVDYSVNGAAFVPGKPRLWSDKRIFYIGTSNLDLAPDGKRFVVLNMPQAAGPEKGTVHVTMLQNFFDQVKRKIP